MKRYVALLEPYKGEYGVVFPDLPGCTSHGATYEAALRNAVDALAGYAAAVADAGEAMPEPRTVEQVRADGDTDWYELADRLIAVVPLVPIDTDQAVRITLSISPHLLTAIDADAKARGLTRSAYVAEASRRLMVEP